MTLDEERQILATALLEVHESKRSARRNAAHVAITADQMKEAAQRLEELAGDPDSADSGPATTALERLPDADAIRRAVAELIKERARESAARKRAALLELAD